MKKEYQSIIKRNTFFACTLDSERIPLNKLKQRHKWLDVTPYADSGRSYAKRPFPSRASALFLFYLHITVYFILFSLFQFFEDKRNKNGLSGLFTVDRIFQWSYWPYQFNEEYIMPKTDSSAGRPRRSYRSSRNCLRQSWRKAISATGTNCPRNGALAECSFGVSRSSVPRSHPCPCRKRAPRK